MEKKLLYRLSKTGLGLIRGCLVQLCSFGISQLCTCHNVIPTEIQKNTQFFFLLLYFSTVHVFSIIATFKTFTLYFALPLLLSATLGTTINTTLLPSIVLGTHAPDSSTYSIDHQKIFSIDSIRRVPF